MALAVVGSGTQTAVITTEHTLDTETGGKTYVLVVNLSNLANGDTVELRLKTKVLSGSASAIAAYATYSHAQEVDVVYSVPVPANQELIATLKQTAGTGRNFEWALLTID